MNLKHYANFGPSVSVCQGRKIITEDAYSNEQWPYLHGFRLSILIPIYAQTRECKTKKASTCDKSFQLCTFGLCHLSCHHSLVSILLVPEEICAIIFQYSSKNETDSGKTCMILKTPKHIFCFLSVIQTLIQVYNIPSELYHTHFLFFSSRPRIKIIMTKSPEITVFQQRTNRGSWNKKMSFALVVPPLAIVLPAWNHIQNQKIP